jgi:hypothetical protein
VTTPSAQAGAAGFDRPDDNKIQRDHLPQLARNGPSRAVRSAGVLLPMSVV